MLAGVLTGRSAKIYVIIKPIDPVPLGWHIVGVKEAVIKNVEGGHGLEKEEVISCFIITSSHV